MPALELLAEVIDTIDEPHLILDCAGHIKHQNGACRDVFSRAACQSDLAEEASRIARSFASGNRHQPAHAPYDQARVGEVRCRGESYRLRASFLKPTSRNREALVLIGVERIPGAGRTPNRNAPALKAKYLLTPREMQVVDLLELGESNKSIAEKLGVSIHTARHHTERVLAKLGARGRAEVGAVLRRLHR